MTIEKLPYLSAEFLDGLAISTSDVIDEIERQIIGQRRGEVWCAPKAVVLPGDDRYIMRRRSLALKRVLPSRGMVSSGPGEFRATRRLAFPFRTRHRAETKARARGGAGATRRP